MIRRKAPSPWARVKAGLAVGFTPAADGVAARQSALSIHIRAVRQQVFHARRTCQACSGTRWRDCNGWPDQLHEDPPRSATRGLPPAVRFNVRVCARLCRACHCDVTEHRIRLVPETAHGFAGPVHVERVDTKHHR